ncbi:MAG: DUF5060 domain-containing protein [Chitinispirillaceae bacterium]|nr:DUF5060 domain-containing protein [Chitinispirillaceae bacterium]
MRTRVVVLLLTGCFLAPYAQTSPPIIITGDTTDRHTMTVTVNGPGASETGTINPFTDYKLTVVFQYILSGAERYQVPGYYAADGNAGETGASSGNIWKAHFTPQWPGAHIYTVYFRTGPNIALNDTLLAGTPIDGIDGDTGSFEFKEEGDDVPPDLKALGRLDNDKFKNYMVIVKNGYSEKRIFLKSGTASPSNFLDYADFDNTPGSVYTKTFADHVADWTNGDPVWGGGQKGKGIIGALNYLSSKGVNTVSFNTLTVGGTDSSIFPYISPDSLTRFDCSKLDQWQTVFQHANSKGTIMELRTQMAANDKLLDNGDCGPARKLYYRELIARFAHNLGIIWNLGDENSQSIEQRAATANYIRRIDPHRYPSRPIILPVAEGAQAQAAQSLYNDTSWITGISLQTNYLNVHDETKKLVDSITAYDYNGMNPKLRSVTSDCQTPKETGVPADGFTGTPSRDDIRKHVLWGNLMAKGAGVNYYFGSTADLTCQNFRSYDKLWNYYRHAETFFRNYLLGNTLLLSNQLVSMSNSDNQLSNAPGYCLSLDGYQPFAVYLPTGGNASLDLSTSTTSDTLRVWWYNPRSGGILQKGALLIGGGTVSLGNPPSDADNDWALLIVPENIGAPDEGVGVRAIKTNGRAFTRALQSITTHDGVVTLSLPPAAKHDLVEIMACNGKVVTACRPNPCRTMVIRLPVRGVYLVCGKWAGKRAVIARVVRL